MKDDTKAKKLKWLWNISSIVFVVTLIPRTIATIYYVYLMLGRYVIGSSKTEDKNENDL